MVAAGGGACSSTAGWKRTRWSCYVGSQAADLTGDYEALFQEYGINCAVVSVDSPLYERLVLDESMTLVHSDASRAVFARPQPG